jgi:cell division protein FtsB
MATAARHARAEAPAPRYEREARDETSAYAYRAPRTRKRAAQRSRLMRTFVIFVGCLTVLAVGRVALSFAVVQKTLQTDAIVREERRISDKNDQLEEQLAQLGSPVRVRHIAESELGLVDATHPVYPEPLLPKSDAEVAATR